MPRPFAMLTITDRVFGPFELVTPVAETPGRMLFVARRAGSDEAVLLQVYTAPEVREPDQFRRLRADVHMIDDLRHPNFVTILEFGSHQQLPYVVMGMVVGPDGHVMSLHDYLAQRGAEPVDSALAERWTRQLAGIMAQLHSRGVHIADLCDRVVLVDAAFDLCVAGVGFHAPVSAARVAAGQAGVLDPRTALQAAEETAACQRDFAGLGEIAYRLVKGTLPPRHPGPGMDRAPGLSGKWARICGRCLTDGLPRHYASAREIIEDLEGSPRRKFIRLPKRLVAYLALILLLFAAIIIQLVQIADDGTPEVSGDRITVEGRGPASQPWMRRYRILEYGSDMVVELGGGVMLQAVQVPSGRFVMGSSDREAGRHPAEGPSHEVYFPKAFHMSVTEITRAQYRAVTGSASGDDALAASLPMEPLSWDDCTAYCQRMTSLTGRRVRLPTEAEWEYACRAGSSSSWSFGEGSSSLGSVAWYGPNSQQRCQPVGQKKPNSWGLYDMHGNVSEWCSDWFAPYGNGMQTRPTGPSMGMDRVRRGGDCTSEAADTRSAARAKSQPTRRVARTGFRIVIDPRQ